MAPVRHRRRLHAARLLAVAAPVGTVALAAAAVLVGGPLLVVAAVVGAAASAGLGAALLRVERAGRVEVATVRATQAAAYAREHERHSGEHRVFTTHLVGMLDHAESRVATMRERLDGVEAEISATRDALAARDAEAAASPSQELVRLGDGVGWEDLWPDLSDAPTVVDLISWEDRVRHGLVPEDGPAERSA
ncbi:MAG TPA: hypothetical protein VK894_05130 [Jiangellales bacterium]|nr:hypothetical protein [Jiangellales bacterium]